MVGVFLMLPVCGAAQDGCVSVRPKIGLVLSGGGAKGLAHVGVLKVLEDVGIVPDYITGTSMGSIIGGLYASGYTAAQLDSIVRTANWNQLLSDLVPLENVVPHEKNDYSRFLSSFDLTRQGLKYKAGLIQGQLISEFLSALTWPVAQITDFDSLPIPFRCVAADLISGKPYVFKSGNLATAMRASMAIPSVFAPVIMDNMVLVDGGVLDNFPVKLCKEMGADIIIGVNVGFTDEFTVENLNSMRRILIAASSIGSNLQSEESRKLTDIYIQPDLKPYTTASFFEGGRIIDLGMKHSVPLIDSLAHLAEKVYAHEPPKTVCKPLMVNKIKISRIESKGLKNISHDFLIAHLQFDDGDSITPAMVSRGMRKLLGTRFFDYVNYELQYDGGPYIMKLTTVETYPTKFDFSLNYNNVFGAAIIGNITVRNLTVKNTRMSVTAEASKSPQFNVNIASFLGDGMNYGVILDGGYSRSILPLYRVGNGRYGTFSYRYTYSTFSFDFTPSTKLSFSPGITLERHILLSDTGFPELFDSGVRKFGYNQSMILFPIRFNSLNNRYLPTRGVKAEAVGIANYWLSEVYKGRESARHLVNDFYSRADNQFIAVSGNITGYIPVSSRINIALAGAASYFVINDAPLSSLYFVGGDNLVTRIHDIPFTGLHYREQLVENFIYSQTRLRFNMFKSFYVTGIINGIYNTRPYSRFMPSSISYFDRKWLVGYGLNLSVNSMLGPISFGFGLNNHDKNPRFYFNVGLPF